MRSVIVVAVLVAAGCTSSREKDCKDLLPIVDAAHANPSEENLARLKGFKAKEQELADAVTAYAKTVERLNGGRRAVDQLVATLKMKSDAGAFSLSMFDASRPHAERLVSLCLPANAPPECAALSRALDACITPAKDDTSAEEQLLTCASDFAAVRSPEPATNESIQALATTLRDFEPFARNIGAPATDVIKAAKEVLPKITDAQKARADANQAEIALRMQCAPDRR
jgi:hypothetical protein